MKITQRWIPLTDFTILTIMVIALLIVTILTGLKSQITGCRSLVCGHSQPGGNCGI